MEGRLIAQNCGYGYTCYGSIQAHPVGYVPPSIGVVWLATGKLLELAVSFHFLPVSDDKEILPSSISKPTGGRGVAIAIGMVSIIAATITSWSSTPSVAIRVSLGDLSVVRAVIQGGPWSVWMILLGLESKSMVLDTVQTWSSTSPLLSPPLLSCSCFCWCWFGCGYGYRNSSLYH